MDNFWDAKNLAGLRDMIFKAAKPMPLQRPLGLAPLSFGVAVGAAYVVLRAAPQEGAPVVGVLRRGETLGFDTEQGSWLRTAQPVGHSGTHGWAPSGLPLQQVT